MANDRMSHRCACNFGMFKPSFEVSEFQNTLCDFFKNGGVRFDASDKNDEDALLNTFKQQGASIVEVLEALQVECRALRAIKEFMGDWEDTVWLLRMMCRATVGEARFCEFMYMYGVGQSGKDLILLLYSVFFGDGEVNYFCPLGGDFLVKAGLTSKEGASPFLASIRGKRLVVASEVPKHTELQKDLIKKYTEQMGVKLTARKLYKAAQSFRPIGLLVATSNFPPGIPETERDDDGLLRRCRVWHTTGKFVKTPKNDTEKQADLTLGPRILSGEFNPQMLFLANLLYPTLSMEVCPDITITPKPLSMEEATKELGAGGQGELIAQWLMASFKPVPRVDAMRIDLFKTLLSDKFKMSVLALKPILTGMGIKADGEVNTKKVRVAVWGAMAVSDPQKLACAKAPKLDGLQLNAMG